MIKQLPTRQRVRKTILLASFLAFPVIMNYLSPYVIINGAMEGVVNGSLIMFGLMFISSLFLGRAWCGWVCPGGAMQDLAEPINRKPVNGRKIDWIKWAIWIPWISLIVFLAVQAGGYQRVDFFHLTEGGISVVATPDRPLFASYIIYYIVILTFVVLAITVGRRAGCHTICWMAPFMIIGRWIRNRFGYPSLRLQANPDACTDCKTCTRNCPMSLDVNGMVASGQMENSECILCGMCVDNCSKSAIHFAFSSGK